MRSPFSPLHFIFFVIALVALVTIIQLGALTIAFSKLGLSQHSAVLLLISSFLGSTINLPLFKINATQTTPIQPPAFLRGLLRQPTAPFNGKTIVAVNLGGCLIPATLSVYLLLNSAPGVMKVMIATAIVSAICYRFSRPLHGIGIGMPMFIAPLTAALVAIVLAPENSAAIAYISGTLGVIIGADIMRLKDIRSMGTPVASIGGAGTFDGIFITGIVAVLLA